MTGVIPDNTNDQARLNWALEEMDMKWENPHSDMTHDTMVGEGREGFTAAVLPVKDVCRQTCTKKMIRVSACQLSVVPIHPQGRRNCVHGYCMYLRHTHSQFFCLSLQHYYIWHKGGAQNRDGKMSYASKGGLWYLRSNWEQSSKQSTSTGIAWLREIAR